MLQESIKVSPIVVSVEQLIYLFLTRFCLTWKTELFEQRRIRLRV
jgi:hypothetical protein